MEAAIARLADKLDCPVIVKEVGAGLGPDVVRRLYAAGAAYVDVAAKGGTNWALIEWLRQNPDKQALYSPFLQMGIGLPEAVRAARHAVPNIQIIASGGCETALISQKRYGWAQIWLAWPGRCCKRWKMRSASFILQG